MTENQIVRCADVCEIVNVNKNARLITHTITTGARNLHGQRVVQAGAEMDEFHKGGVVLFGHDDAQPAIGKNTGLLLERDRWVADTEFADTRFGNELLYLYSNGFMKAWSIGFRPLEVEYVKDKAGRVEEIVFPKWKLKEYSAVTLGANIDAVNHALRINAIGESTHRLLNYAYDLTPDPARPDEDLPASALESLAAMRLNLSLGLTSTKLEG